MEIVQQSACFFDNAEGAQIISEAEFMNVQFHWGFYA